MSVKRNPLVKRVLIIASAAVLLLVLGAGGYAWYLYHDATDTISDIYQPIGTVPPAGDGTQAVAGGAGGTSSEGTATGAVQLAATGDANPSDTARRIVDLNAKDPFTVLLLGVDERSGDVGRSDTIMVVGVNPAKHSVLLYNIPRDTRTEIVGKGTTDKINHAYAFGGVDMSIRTVERFMNVPIDYYVKVNMEGFERIIDILGGVTVNNPFGFTIDGVNYPQGQLDLDGENALLYSRMRYDDPKGDIGRIERQQTVMGELINKAKRIKTVTKVPEILDEIRANAKTNLTLDDMKALFNNYRKEINTVSKDQVNGGGERIGGIYYYMVSEQERTRMHDKLASQLANDGI
ncbi:LCP family protein [Cohnella hashimotonis]|uniref:LCP family protein n=1 Tax=Cohnella hashimotonis TaxID=2826895 RepID=A0ABT6TP22_9BACL|nr:LCP family protein [Cohnella hashimotonis]MDI4648603.1 LCP family protein [Cohnella hashimotonis]